MGRPVRSCAASRGFTLIELMAATAIFLGGMTAVLRAQTTAQGVNAMAHHWTIAGMVGDNVLELLTLMPTSKLQALGTLNQGYDADGALLTGAPANAFFKVKATVGAGALPIYQTLHVVVSVTWTEPYTRQSRVLQVDNEVPL